MHEKKKACPGTFCRQYLSNRARYGFKFERGQAPLAKRLLLRRLLSAHVNDQDVLEVDKQVLTIRKWCLERKRRRKRCESSAAAGFSAVAGRWWGACPSKWVTIFTERMVVCCLCRAVVTCLATGWVSETGLFERFYVL